MASLRSLAIGVGCQVLARKPQFFPNWLLTLHWARLASLHQSVGAMLQTSQAEAASPVRTKLQNAHVPSAAFHLSNQITGFGQANRQANPNSRRQENRFHASKGEAVKSCCKGV